MEKRSVVEIEKKATIVNQRARLAEYVAWRDKKATHVLIRNEMKKVLDMMDEVQAIMWQHQAPAWRMI